MEKLRERFKTFFGQVTQKNTLNNIVYLSVATLLFLGLDAFQSYNYLLFHSIAEIISIVSSFIIFIIVLMTWKHLRENNYLCFLGITFFFIGLMDIMHMLSFKGMGIFKGYDSDLPIQLWIIARYIQAFSLLIAVMLIKRKEQINGKSVFLTYAIVCGIVLGMIFYWDIFPECYIEGYGLTPFKIVSEYIISILFICSAAMMLRYKKVFKKEILWLLLVSTVFQILAELSFTTYNDLYAFANFLGHYFKIIAIVLFSKAILVTLDEEVLEREKNEEKLQEERTFTEALLESLPGYLYVYDELGRLVRWNKKHEEMTGYTAEELPYMTLDKWFEGEDVLRVAAAAEEVFQKGYGEVEAHLIMKNGKKRHVRSNGVLLKIKGKNYFTGIGMDIGKQKKDEEELLRLNSNLESIITERTIQLEEINCELEETNTMLEEEISERKKVETEILRLNSNLENIVKERTYQLEEMNCELEETNAMLEEEVSERQKVEKEIMALNQTLDKSNTLLTSVLESSPEIIIFALDSNYCYLSFNTRHKEVMFAIWGKEITVGMNMLAVIGNHEDSYKAEQNFKRVLAGESFTLIEEYGDEQCSRLTWQDYWSPIFSNDGNVIGITCFVLNITELKRIEDALKESEERFRTMFEQAPLGMALIDSITGQIYHVNVRFAEIIGRTMDEMRISNWMGITHPDDIQEELANMAQLNTGKILGFRMNKRYIRLNQSIVWTNMTAAALKVEEEGKPCHLCMIEDITESKAIQERLEKYQIIVEKANDIIMFLDFQGNILEVNDAAVRMYGYTFEEFLTMTIFDLRRLEKEEYVIAQMNRAYQEGIVFETTHYRKDGTFFPVEVSSQGNSLGNKNVILSIVRDISERKKHEEIVIATMKKAEAANAAKGQFLANMSHEIRTPMNGIIGMTDLALMADSEQEQREYLRIVKSSTMSLLRVLNDILDYSKIEAGKIDLEEVPFHLSTIITEVVELFDVSAKQSGLALTLHFDNQIPNAIIGDSLRLRQVLSNLVGNGIKFTTQGEVSICVALEEQQEDKVKIKFVITDTGIGISTDKLNKLFKRFSQVDDSNTRQFGGTGLGLAISQKLVELMGGEIGVESKESIGSQFFFTAIFRLQGGSNPLIGEDAAYEKNTALGRVKQKKVLLAEDDLVSRKIVTNFLIKHGFQVHAVENGREAVAACEKKKFDIILMDINMPYLDGYSVTTIIQSTEKNMNCFTPIVAMTAYALKGDKEKCLEAGMDDYISKPINLREFLTMMEKYTDGTG